MRFHVSPDEVVALDAVSVGPLASADDMTIPRCFNTAEEAIALIREYHAKWLQEQKT